MESQELLSEHFEIHRRRLHGVAHRMLGSSTEAEDAVQETWLRLSRSDTGDIENLGGWLTTVLSRICLDLLRSRAAHREDFLGSRSESTTASTGEGVDPQRDALLADEIGLALLVVLDRLTPAERIAFVLHDVFAVPFAEIGAVVGRSPAAARKLASRARTRVRGAAVPDADLARRWRVAETFLEAARGGDRTALLAVLDRDVVRRADHQVVPTGAATVLRGAEAVADGALRYSRAARHLARVALVDGSPGLVVAPAGRLRVALRLTIGTDTITEVDVIADPRRLQRIDIVW
jgi:RNA polymerase sigma factor (sigma-70 family)